MRPEQYFDQPLLSPTMKDMRRVDYVYASALGFLTKEGKVYGGCRRKEYLRLTGTPESNPPTIDAYRKMLYGDYVGRAEVELAKQARIYVKDEVAVQEDTHKISGRIDLVIIDPQATSDPYIGIEHKSIHGDWAVRKKISPPPGKSPETDMGHLAQIALYAYVYRNAIKRWWLRYLARDSGQVGKQEVVLLSDGSLSANGGMTGRNINELFAWADSVHQSVSAKKLPAHDFSLLLSPEQLREMADAGDLCKTDTERVKKGNKVIKGDWRCLAPDTLIPMATGPMKAISDIQTGDQIVSIDGAVTVKKIEGKAPITNCVTVKPSGMLPVICTEDHNWLVADMPIYKRQKGEGFIPRFVQAKDLMTNDDLHVIMPVHKPFNAMGTITENQAAFLGYFMAEGCLANCQNGTYYRVEFTVGTHEDELTNKISSLCVALFGKQPTVKDHEDHRHEKVRRYRSIKLHSVEAATFVRSHIIGRKATKKMAGPGIMNADVKSVLSFLHAAEEGDGHYDEKQECQMIATSSRKLCQQYQQLYWRCGIPAVACLGNKPKMWDQYQCAQAYRVQHQGEHGILKFMTIGENKYVITHIHSVKPCESPQVVYDIEVSGQYPIFATESGFVHNCSYCSYTSSCWANEKLPYDLTLQEALLKLGL